MSWALFQTGDSFAYAEEESSGDEEVRYYHGDEEATSHFLDTIQYQNTAKQRSGHSLLAWGQAVPEKETSELDHSSEVDDAEECLRIVHQLQRGPTSPTLLNDASQCTAAGTQRSSQAVPGGPTAGPTDDFLEFFPEWVPAPSPPKVQPPRPSQQQAQPKAKARRLSQKRQQAPPSKRSRIIPSQYEDAAGPVEDISDFSDDEAPLSAGKRRHVAPQGNWEGVFGRAEVETPTSEIRVRQAPLADVFGDTPKRPGPPRPGAGVEDEIIVDDLTPPDLAVRRTLFGLDDPAPAPAHAPSQQQGHALSTAVFQQHHPHPGARTNHPLGSSQCNLRGDFLDSDAQVEPAFQNNPPPKRRSFKWSPERRRSGHSPGRWCSQSSSQLPLGEEVEDADDLIVRDPNQGHLGLSQHSAAMTPVHGPPKSTQYFGTLLDASPDAGPLFSPNQHRQSADIRWMVFSPVRYRKGHFSNMLHMAISQLQTEYKMWSQLVASCASADAYCEALEKAQKPGPSTQAQGNLLGTTQLTRMTQGSRMTQAAAAPSFLVVRVRDTRLEYSVCCADCTVVFKSEDRESDGPCDNLPLQDGPPLTVLFMQQQHSGLSLRPGSMVEIHRPWRSLMLQRGHAVSEAIACTYFSRPYQAQQPPTAIAAPPLNGPEGADDSFEWDEAQVVEG